uniref:DUF932 domain-containing protein n=1 Tax=Escherichia coli TaxID=562 RepID=UPI000AF5DE86
AAIDKALKPVGLSGMFGKGGYMDGPGGGITPVNINGTVWFQGDGCKANTCGWDFIVTLYNPKTHEVVGYRYFGLDDPAYLVWFGEIGVHEFAYLVKNYVEEKRDAMQSLVLPPPARQALAQAALTYRYGDEHQPVTTADILTPRRREDYGKDLWSAYQTIQENMLKGGISGLSAKGKRIHTRAIHSIDTDIKLNRALWVMAETMLESLR